MKIKKWYSMASSWPLCHAWTLWPFFWQNATKSCWEFLSVAIRYSAWPSATKRSVSLALSSGIGQGRWRASKKWLTIAISRACVATACVSACSSSDCSAVSTLSNRVCDMNKITKLPTKLVKIWGWWQFLQVKNPPISERIWMIWIITPLHASTPPDVTHCQLGLA